MSFERAPLEPDTIAPHWSDPLAMFIAWLTRIFDQITKLKRIRRTTTFKADWRDHWPNLRQLEWIRDQILAACAARLLAGETLNAESDFTPSTDPPAGYGGPCPRTPFDMNRRFLAIARFNADPEAAILEHVRRIAKRAGIDLSNPLAAHGSTDATLRAAAHHELVSADPPQALILSSAQRARPSTCRAEAQRRRKDERVLAHARDPPQPAPSPHVIANSLAPAHRDGDGARMSALDKTIHGAIVPPMTNISARVDAAVQSAIDEKRIVGAVIAVMQDGKFAHLKAYGMADREAGVAMKEDAIFRLASISKPIVTAAAMAMIEAGKFTLDTPVTDFLPNFKPKAPDGSTPTITIRHLLTHTAGLSYDFLQPPEGPYNTIPVSAGIDGDFTMEDNLNRMVQAGLSFPPDAAWLYSVAIDVLGAVMAKAEGTDVEGTVQKYVLGPMDMSDTSFYVTDPSRLVQPYSNAAPEPVAIGDNFKQPFVPGCGPINLGTSRAFNRNAFQGGGGCMNGKALDVVRLLDTIRSGGDPILSEASTQQMMSNQIGPLRIMFDPTGNTAFGFGGSYLIDPVATGSLLSQGSWSWGGVWGHSWFVDPTRKTTVLNLTNTTLEGMVGQLPGDIQKAVFGG